MSMTNINNLNNVSTLKLNSGIKFKYNEKRNNNINKLLLLVNVSCWILSVISIICIIFTFMPLILIINDSTNSNVYSILNNSTINTTSILVGSKQLISNKNLIRNLLLNFSNKLHNVNQDSFIRTFGSDILSICADSYGEFNRVSRYCYFYLIQTINNHRNEYFFDKKNKLSRTFVDHANKFFLDLSEKYASLNNKCVKFIFKLGEKCLNIDYIIDQLLFLVSVLDNNISRYQEHIWKSELSFNKREMHDYEIRDALLIFNDLFLPNHLSEENYNKINNLYNSGFQFTKSIVYNIIETLLDTTDDKNNRFLDLIQIKNKDIILNRLLYIIKVLMNHKDNISAYKYSLRSMEFRNAMCLAISDLNILQNINNEISLSLDNIQNRIYMYNDTNETLQFPYQIDKSEYGGFISNMLGLNKITNISKHKEYVITKILNRVNLVDNLNGFMCKNGLEAYLRNNYRIEFECFEKDIGNFCKFSTWYLNSYNNSIIQYMKNSIKDDFKYNSENIRRIIIKKLKDLNDIKSVSKIGRDSYSYGDIIHFISIIDRNIT